MAEYQISILIYIVAVFVSSVSQIILKKSANKDYSSRIKEYLNIYVISAYSLFILTTFATILALKNIAISTGSVLETLGYVFVAVLSRVLLKEQISRKAKIGYLFIVVGIILFEVL